VALMPSSSGAEKQSNLMVDAEAPAVFVLSIPYVDPVAAFAPFADQSMAAFLDSALTGSSTSSHGRYSYIAIDPYRVLTAGEQTILDGHIVADDPFTVLARELAACSWPHASVAEDIPVPFQTGAIGFFAYELGRHLEQLPAPAPNDLDIPEMVIGFYDTIAAFDTEKKRAWVLARSEPIAHLSKPRASAEFRAQALATKLAKTPGLTPFDEMPWGSWSAETTPEEYEARIRQAIDYIYAGDVFQVNLTQRFVGTLGENIGPYRLYRRLRAINPSPYAAFLRTGGQQAIVSASPECYLSLRANRQVVTRPIKGTSPRGVNPQEDAALAARLQCSEKDRAENLMIVDLLRNDLSRVCSIGSVKTKKLFSLESFASVHHLVSEVHGELSADATAVDLLKATFPGGSITGAPKIRAMEIINELEPTRRGPYCGAIAWLGCDGAMEASIVIRTLTVSGRTVVAQAGGGIVADSDPRAEYTESLDKIGPLLAALDPTWERHA
jgi:para-aminobenzoate synthetase component 1